MIVRRSGLSFSSAPVWLVVGFNLFCVAWIVITSLKTTREVFDHPWALPAIPQWQNFVRAWQVGNFGVATMNSLLVAGSTALTTVLLAAPAAYALSRFGVRVASPLTALFVVGIGIPSQVVVLPVYSLMNMLGLVDTLFGLWILYVATSLPFAVFFLTSFFASLSSELEQAAALDGAGPVRTFWAIMLPLARSGIVTLVILNVIAHWNETIFALILLQTDARETVPLALLKFLQTMQYNAADWGGLFAGICIVVLPVLALYVWLGRRIIEGLALGSGR